MADDIRALPHDPEAEKAALGAVLLKAAAMDDLAALRPDDFFMPIHRLIFEAMRALEVAKKPIELVMLEDEMRRQETWRRLEGGATFLVGLVDACGSAEHAPHYAAVVAEKSQLRRLVATCAEVRSAALGERSRRKISWPICGDRPARSRSSPRVARFGSGTKWTRW